MVRNQTYIATIGDIVNSKKLTRAARSRLQSRFERLLDVLNDKYQESLASKLSITLGDEFQGVLKDPSIIPEIIWDIEEGLDDQKIRIGFGSGELYTPVLEYSAKMDGPAFHNARAAIIAAEDDALLGGRFKGFNDFDPVLNGLAHVLWFHRAGWTDKQKQVVSYLRRFVHQSAVATQLGVSRQTVSRHALAAGSEAYMEAEHAWRLLLLIYDRDITGKKIRGR